MAESGDAEILRPLDSETHDYGGPSKTITSYSATGIEAASRPVSIHYGGDMFLYQAPGFDAGPRACDPFLNAAQELALSASRLASAAPTRRASVRHLRLRPTKKDRPDIRSRAAGSSIAFDPRVSWSIARKRRERYLPAWARARSSGNSCW